MRIQNRVRHCVSASFLFRHTSYVGDLAVAVENTVICDLYHMRFQPFVNVNISGIIVKFIIKVI